MRRALALALLLAPQEGEKKQHETAFQPPFDFVLYGDCRSGHDVHRRVVAAILQTEAKFVIQSGDIVYSGDSDKDWETWRGITKELREKMGYYPVKGNHDGGKKGAFQKEFGLEKTHYDKVLGNIHFFFLDTNSAAAPQLEWLAKAVEGSKSPHRVAVMHAPPITLVASRVATAARVKERFHAALVKLKFCAALCGHDHHFYAGRRDGLPYVVSGGGGASLYSTKEELAEKGDLWKKAHHFVLCRSEEKSIAARVMDPDGKEIEGLKLALCEHKEGK